MSPLYLYDLYIESLRDALSQARTVIDAAIDAESRRWPAREDEPSWLTEARHTIDLIDTTLETPT